MDADVDRSAAGRVQSAATADTRDAAKERYTHGHHESVLRSHVWRNVANSAAYVADELVPGTRVLDVGCGPGTITVDIAARVAPGFVVGVDMAPEVLAAAATVQPLADVATDERRRSADVAMRLVVGRATALPFGSNTFDIVHAHQVLQHLADPVAALREMYRVVAPGGLVAARDVDYGAMFWFPHSPVLDEWMSAYQAVHRGNGGEPDAGRRLTAWARAADLGDVTSTGSMWTYGTMAERAWWGGMWADRVVRSAFATQAIDRGVAHRDDLQRMADGWRAWAAEPDGWFAVPHGEVVLRKPPELS